MIVLSLVLQGLPLVSPSRISAEARNRITFNAFSCQKEQQQVTGVVCIPHCICMSLSTCYKSITSQSDGITS